MNRLEITFNQLQSNRRKVLVSYIVAGDPNQEITVDAMHALVSGGTNIIELGIAFSDPSAEGPTIQKAHERALVTNTSLANIFAMVRDFRANNTETPIVLMGYANPIEWMGYETFAMQASEAGVDAVLIVDLPAEESQLFNEQLQCHQLNNVYLLAPTSSLERIKNTCKIANGFIYYVSLKGVTGSGDLDTEEVIEKLATIKRYTSLPICVGFGIKNADNAKAIATHADGIVVGSALVELMANTDSNQQICTDLASAVSVFRRAIDSV